MESFLIPYYNINQRPTHSGQIQLRKGDLNYEKFVCTVCGYVHEGDAAPAECPVCHAPADKFKEQTGERSWAAEHVVGVAQGVSEDILADLRATLKENVQKLVCTLLWQELLTEKDIRKSDYTGKKLPGKKQSTLLNSLNC